MVRLEVLRSARNPTGSWRFARTLPRSPTARSARTSGTVRYPAGTVSCSDVSPYDEDYDRITEITGQATRWLPRRDRLR